MQRIIEVNGGEARVVSHNINARAKILRSDYLKAVENQVLICTKEGNDKQLRGKFKSEVEAEGRDCRIFTSDWIMSCVLRQELVEDGNFVIAA